MRKLTKTENSEVWKRFYAEFCFCPSTTSFPSIKEPQYSITFSIPHFFNHTEYTELVQKFAQAAQESLLQDKKLYLLDWQHQCYCMGLCTDTQFTIIFDGEYAICLTEDFSFGSFWHPWEHTLCLFGREFTHRLLELHPKLLSKPIRFQGFELLNQTSFHLKSINPLGGNTYVHSDMRELLINRELTIKKMMPNSVLDWFSLKDSITLFNSASFDVNLVEPNHLGVDLEEVEQGWLFVGIENSSSKGIYVPFDKGDNPPVYQNRGDWEKELSQIKWLQIDSTFSEFICRQATTDKFV